MRCRSVLVLAFAAAGCMTVQQAGPVPADLAVNRRWESNADGYVYTVGYFTPEQVRSPAWEAARIARMATVHLCDNREIVGRDIRWYEPIAPGEPTCAAVVYSIACRPRRPEWGSSLEYGRRQAMVEDMPSPIQANCGEKDGSRLPNPRVPFVTDAVLGSFMFCRDMLPDITVGRFRLREVNHVQERTIVPTEYIRRGRPFSGGAAAFLRVAATDEQRVHFVISSRELPHDRHNIFVDQVFSDNSEGYCVTLTARQGDALWRRTIKRDSIPGTDRSMKDGKGHSLDPAEYWDAQSDAHMLQHQLALHLGLPLPRDHRIEASRGYDGD
ncbi:hypothetical protein [Sphingosinicella terrae]|uniref:hypothetical protein n=1 Tax=Sphingosinicella terrae TaxID=2172047 RepID=UPI000E0DAA76|nr:hypothetical protein [Sphingosinicella terrae]